MNKFYNLGITLFLALLAMANLNPTYGQEAPIIDRELFFGDPEIAGGQISPDGNFISFLKPFKTIDENKPKNSPQNAEPMPKR